MEIVSADRPGLLSTVGEAFIEQDVDIDTAKVLTIGERAEDVFYVVETDGTPLSDERCKELRCSNHRSSRCTRLGPVNAMPADDNIRSTIEGGFADPEAVEEDQLRAAVDAAH